MSNQVSGSGFQVSGDAIQAQPVVNGDVAVSSQLSVVSDPATAQGNGGAQQTSVVSGQGTIQQPNNPITQQPIPDPAVDEVVAQAKKVQDLFAKNDALLARQPAVNSQQLTQQSTNNSQPIPYRQAPDGRLAVQDDKDDLKSLSSLSTPPTTSTQQQPTQQDLGVVSQQLPTTNLPTGQAGQVTDHPLVQDPSSITHNPPSTSDDQKSPLDILEEILRKEEKKQAEKEAVVSQEETENQKQLEAQQEAENQALIEEARKKMIQETATEEQKQRDAIRQQQIDANKVHNPYEIRQLEHVKRGQG